MNVKSDVNSENLKNVGQKNSASKETGFSSGKSVNGFLEQLVAHSSDFTFNPETVRRIAGDIKAQIISEHEKEIESEKKHLINTVYSSDDQFYDSYIHSDEFISLFGDWEKANRLEKLKKSPSVVCSGEIRIIGSDVSDLVIRLRKNYSKENLKQLQTIARDAGREIIENLRKEQHLKSPFPPVIKNIDSGKEFKLQMTGINEIKNHNIFQKGHIEAISSIPEIIKNGIFISSELNEDSRKPEYKKFHYFATGFKLEQEDYTCKIVFTENKEGEIFYDQSLSTIEKGKLVDILKKTNVEKKKPDNSMEEMPGNENVINPLISQDDSPNTYYDKRLINICQVPQMPYLTQNDDGLWTPTQEAIKAVMNGTLYINKEGQTYYMVDLNEQSHRQDFKEKEMDEVNEKRVLDPEEIGEQLAELDSRVWNELGIESGSDFTGHPEKIKSFASSVKDYLDANGIKELDRETFSFLEAINYHTLNNILGLHGVYGEEFRRRAIERADSPYSNYDRNTALEIVNGIDREEILDKGIERMQENGGVSDSAAEAEMNARDNLRADYLDADGNPHWFDEEEEQAEEQEIEEDSPAPAESTITEGNLYPDDVNSAKTKLGDIVRETFLSLSDDEKEAGTTTEQKYTRYEKWHRPMIDEIMASVTAGDKDLLRKISDFDLNKASHKEGNSYYSEDEGFKRDVNYKLLPELYEIVQNKIIEKYDNDKTPYVILNWSESSVFPIENKVYTLKEFNELLTQADKEFHNRKEYAENKYGSADNYWNLEDADELPEEDKGISFGYDKTNFKLCNIPNPENPEDTYSYEASRYDIGDGEGSVFDFIRTTCSHDVLIESCNKLEREMYYPDISETQQEFVENAAKEEAALLKQNLVEKMAALDSAQFEYNELHKKWLIESSEAERVDEQIDKALSDIKATYDNSISTLYTKVLNEYPYASTKNISDSQFMLYTANEAKKMLISELYLPSLEAAKDYTKYTSDDWEKFRKIFKQFPAKVNMSGYVENILQEKCNERGYSVSENSDHNVANKIKTDSKQIATNYVLEKLAAAGIEVVTDKFDFNKILNHVEILQKMQEENKVEDLFISKNKPTLDSEIDKLTINDINLQDEFIEISDNTPFVLKECGLSDFPVKMYKQKLARAFFLEVEKYGERITHGHKGEFSVKEVKSVLKNIGNPRYVFNSKSMSNKQNLQLVAVYDDFDKNGDPMILSLRFNKDRKEVEANWVTAVYGKRKNILVNDWTKKGYLVYMNDLELEKAPAEVVTLHMRVSKSASAYDSIIKHKSEFVNDMDLVFYKQNNQIYGFAYNGKIYLDPVLMNSEVAVHEYTHLWDNYTMKTNPELWEKGKEVFKRTSLWNEVKASPDYADIADDDNLVLSECHARIAGKVAAQVLEKIAKENGEIARDKVINWDLEVSAYVYSELSERGERLSSSDFQKLNEFIVSPVKDLLNGRDVPEISVTPDKPLSMKLSPERKPGGNRGIEIFSGNVASIISGARDGSLPALPKDGFSPDGGITIRPAAVRSYLKGQLFTGLNQLVAQKKAAELGLEPDARGSINVITYRQAGEKNIRKGTPHFDLTSYDGANNRMNYYHLYSVKGIIDESKLPPPHKPLVIPSAVIKAEAPDIAPVDYFASYEAATKAGCQFRTNRKTVEAVREKLVAMEKELLKTENYNSLSASIGSRSKKIILDKARNINAELHPRTRCNDRGVDR